MKKTLLLLPVMALLLLGSCDDGPIEEKQAAMTGGKIVKVEGHVTGLRTWPLRYNIAVAGFTSDAENEVAPYASISKVMSADSAGNVSIVISGISGEVSNVEVCVLNRLRQRITTFVSEDITSRVAGDTIRIDIGNLDVSMLATIQSKLFDTRCITCHGASGHAAAGLNLTDGNSYASLVNQPSAVIDSLYRVEPNDSAKSVLYQVVNNTSHNGTLTSIHQSLFGEKDINLVGLVGEWIRNGAPK